MFKNSVIMLNGLPMSGKSTFARILFENIDNAKILKTAVSRFQKELPKSLEIDENDLAIKKDKDNSYKAVLDFAEKIASEGFIPVFDATFHLKYRRIWAYDFAKKNNLKVFLIELSENKEVDKILEKRMLNKSFDNVLNTRENYDIMCSQNEPITNDEFEEFNFAWARINTSIKKADFCGDWKEEEKEIVEKIIK